MVTRFFSFLYVPALMMLILMVNAAPIQERGVKDTLTRAKGKFAGKATFFDPKEEGGSTGACGPHEDNHSDIVALNLSQYGSENKVSEWCFKEVEIHYQGKMTKATITDACPGCQEKSLDLTPSVFQKLASSEEGIINIDWCVIGTDGCSNGGSQKVTVPPKGKDETT